MSDWSLTELINVKLALTGAQGGLVGVFASDRITLSNAAVAVTAGAMTANALAPVFIPYFHGYDVAAAFIVGLGAIPISFLLLNAITRKVSGIVNNRGSR